MDVVGYGPQRTQATELVAGLIDGTGGALAVRGSAGMGKSTLLAETVPQATAIPVLWVQGVATEQTVPFSALHALLAGRAKDHAEELPGPQRQALDVALAVSDGPPPDRLTLSVAVCGLLSALAPLLIVIDDLQWVDASSREILGFVARRAETTGVGMLVAHRPDPGVDAVLAGVPQVRLEGIDVDAAARLLSAQAEIRVPPTVVIRLHHEARGSPLVLTELARALPVEVLRGNVPLADGPLPVRAGTEAAYADRIRELPAETRLALLTATAYGRGDRDVLDAACAVLGLDGDPWTPAVGSVLVRADPQVVFTHPLVQAAAHRIASTEDRHRVHRVLAQVLDDEPTRRVWHLARAAEGPDDALADDVDATAALSASRGGRAEAAWLFEEAAALTTDPQRAELRRLEAARHWQFAGHRGRAAPLLDELLGRDRLTPAGWLDAQLLRGQVSLWHGEILRALKDLTAAADEAVDPIAAAVLRSSASVPAIMSGDIARAIRLADRAREVLVAADHPMAPLAACALAEAVLLAGDRARGLRLLDDLAGWRVDQVEIDIAAITGGFVVAHAFGLAGRWEDSRQQLEWLIDRSREAGALAVLELPLPNLADLHHRFGNLGTARALVVEALEITDFTGNLTGRSHTLAIKARIEAAGGNEAACRADSEAVLSGADRHGWHALETYAHHALGHLELGLGRPDDAIADLLAARRLEEAHGVVDPLVVPYGPDLVEALVHTGRTTEAREATDELAAAVEQTGTPWGHAAVLRCRGLLDDDPAPLEESITLFEEIGAAIDAQRARLVAGQVLRRHQQRAAARDHLRTAADELARRGARGWAAQAARELRAAGGRIHPGRVDRAPTARLTEQEQAIAQLVCAGATNREIAAELYLSAKTIENHLTRMYTKLGVRSRTELTALLNEAR